MTIDNLLNLFGPPGNYSSTKGSITIHWRECVATFIDDQILDASFDPKVRLITYQDVVLKGNVAKLAGRFGVVNPDRHYPELAKGIRIATNGRGVTVAQVSVLLDPRPIKPFTFDFDGHWKPIPQIEEFRKRYEEATGIPQPSIQTELSDEDMSALKEIMASLGFDETSRD